MSRARSSPWTSQQTPTDPQEPRPTGIQSTPRPKAILFKGGSPELLWWCTLSKDILIQMTTPWSAQARDTTLDTRVTHCNFGLIKVETEDQTCGLELHTVRVPTSWSESSPRNDDSDMVEPTAAPSLGHVQSSRLWQMQVWNRSVPYTRTQADALAHHFQLLLRCFIKPHIPLKRSLKAWTDLQTSGSDSSMFSTTTSVMKRHGVLMPVLYVRTFSGHFTEELQRVRKILLEPISLGQRRVQNGVPMFARGSHTLEDLIRFLQVAALSRMHQPYIHRSLHSLAPAVIPSHSTPATNTFCKYPA